MPFAGYKNFADCVAKNQDKENPEAYCAVIMRKVEQVRQHTRKRAIRVRRYARRKR